MAKQNRRINLAKREAQELRAQLAVARTNTATAQRQAEFARACERDTAHELQTLERNLRRFCSHFFLVTPTGKLRPRDYSAPQESRTHPEFFQMQEYQRRVFERTPIIELIHLVLDVEPGDGHPDVARFVHFRVEHPAGPNAKIAYAVSREVLRYTIDQRGPEVMTAMILREFGAMLFADLKKAAQ
jgi:hypothetical protein